MYVLMKDLFLLDHDQESNILGMIRKSNKRKLLLLFIVYATF